MILSAESEAANPRECCTIFSQHSGKARQGTFKVEAAEGPICNVSIRIAAA